MADLWDSIYNRLSSIGNTISNAWNGTPNTAIDFGNGITRDYASWNTEDILPDVYTTLDELGIDQNSLQGQQILSQVDSLGTGGNVGGITGQSGLVDTLGGWGNIMQGIGSLGNLYMGLQNIGLQKDALSLAKDSYNTSKALSQANLNNSVDAYNTSLADRYRARAYAETGDASAYDNQIEERKLNSVSL